MSLPGGDCHGNHLTETRGGQESEGGWRADAKGTNVKGRRKGGVGYRKKGQEEDGDHPRAVENNRKSEMEKYAKTTESTHLIFRGC